MACTCRVFSDVFLSERVRLRIRKFNKTQQIFHVFLAKKLLHTIVESQGEQVNF